ncbi:MAG: haloacid dehalogenase type II [Salinirussus sp.]
MPLDTGRIETITVDSYGTLVNPDAAGDAIAPYVEDPEPVLAQWRATYLSYVMIVDAVDDYRPFDELIRAALERTLGAHGIETTPTEREEIMTVYDDLEPFPDVQDGIAALAADRDVYVLSMGTPAMLDALLETAHIGEFVEDTISVHEIQRYKPHAEVYQHAAARTGTPIDRLVHVAGPSFDVRGAMAAGMQGVWIDRRGEPWDPIFPEPDLRITRFQDLVDALAESG